MAKKKRIIIIGAAGRDFHNFNILYRDDKNTEVIAFSATQIPNIANRKYPPSLAGKFYPKSIGIIDEKDLEEVIRKKKIDECVLSYSDLSYETVMHLASRVISAGAKFSMLGIKQTMLKSKKPVIAVVAVRTGCGKSQTSRAIAEIFKKAGKKVALVRHPMPYGDLAKQKVQRYATLSDLKEYSCTIEEMEEYEPHINMGNVVYAGVDYGEILKKAEKEADVIIWDGGNNDTAFFKPDLTITVTDPLRAGHEISYYPGEVNFRLANVIIINKIDSADKKSVGTILKNAKKYNPRAQIIKTTSVINVENADLIKGKKVLAIEDGPTLTHGEAKIGVGVVAALRNKALEIVDPRPFAFGEIKKIFDNYPNIGALLPAIGYGDKQIQDLEKTINKVNCDLVLIGTPVNLGRLIKINKPSIRITYDYPEETKQKLAKILKEKGFV
jgi:predicted GTPase